MIKTKINKIFMDKFEENLLAKPCREIIVLSS